MKKIILLFSLLISGICIAQTDSLSLIDTTSYPADHIFSKPQKMPSFPGGESEMIKFIQANVKYPEAERKAKVSGTCYATFVVEKDGTITDIKVLRGVANGPGLEAETLRVIKKMPKWIPGKQNNRNVRVQYNLPVKYTL